MKTTLNAYLSFRARAREAMAFYQTVFGGKVTMNTYKEYQAASDPSEDDLIMHSMLEAENGIAFMAADTPKSVQHHEVSNIAMTLSGDDDAELSGYFQKLSAGGSIQEPLVTAPWGDKFGMLTDKFGIQWMVNISPKA